MSDGTSSTTQCCPECGSDVDWGTSSWCPSCGFYPAINFRSEQPMPAGEEVVYDHWWEVVPAWLWSLVVGVCLIVVLSGCVRLLFADSEVRTWWTVAQMGGGVLALGTVHFMAYLYSASRSDKLGPLDMFLQPLATWQPVLRNLPESSNLVCGCAFSITAILAGYLVVNGVSFSALIEQETAALQRHRMEQQEDLQQRKRCALCTIISTAATITQAQQAACSGMPVPNTLNGALAELAGQPVGDAGATPANRGVDRSGFSFVSTADEAVPESIRRDSLPPTQPQGNGTSRTGDRQSSATSPTGSSARPEVECLILGYTTNATGDIRSVLLAAAPDLKFLRFVAKVPVEQVAPDVSRTLLQKFEEIPARKPMVRCPYGGRWIEPELFCIANYDGWTADGRLHNVEVVRLINTQPE